MEVNWGSVFQVVLRWIHFLAGIIWIGHLYFFNFVNANVAKTDDAETKKKVVPELMPRALWWFRWGAMFTFGSGMVLFLLVYWGIMMNLSTGATSAEDSGRLWWITLGGLFGTVMWFNVWFVIWPAQRKIIGWVKKVEAPPEMAGLVATAGKRSRINTYLSVPLLFFMSAAAHADKVTFSWVLAAVVTALGVGIAMHFIKLGTKAGQFTE